MLPIAWTLAAGCGGEQLIVLSDAQNYTFDSTIEATSTVVTSGADTTVDWSGLDVDLLGHPVDPAADVTHVRLVQFENLTQVEVLDGINDDTLPQSALSGFADYVVTGGETSAALTQFDLFGTFVDPAEHITADGGTYLVSIVSGEDDYRTFEFFEPTVDAPAADIEITGASASLSYTVDLDASERVAVERGARVRVDWASLTTNGSGLDIDLGDIDRLVLGRYDEPIAELEADFLQVETLADARWEADVEGWGDWWLDDLEDADGARFDGFDGDGTWVLALQCTTCINPAPPFFAILDPS